MRTIGTWVLAVGLGLAGAARADDGDPFENGDGPGETSVVTPPVTVGGEPAKAPKRRKNKEKRPDVPPPEVCPPTGHDPAFEDLLCVEVRDGRISMAKVLPRDTRVLKPGRHLLVLVQHDDDDQVDVVLEGAIGVWTPGMRGGDGSRGGPPEEAFVPQRTSTRFLLPPMLPPVAKVKLVVADASGEVRDAQTVDFVIQRSYSGAVRMGVATILGPAVGTPYVASTVGGSATTEVVAGTPDPAAFELTLGYVPFLEAGGRAETGCAGLGCLAPYLGLGVVGQGNKGLEFLSSVHAGVEYELAPSFSVAFTAAFRRVDRLLPGLQVGQAVRPDATITTSGLGVGFGVVVNVNPAFFRLALEGAAGR